VSAELLSAPSAAEEKQLGIEHLDQKYRLACQVKIENHGEVVVMVSTVTPRPAPVDTEGELLKKFGTLSLGKKLATLMQLEAVTMSEAFDAAIEKPLAFGTKTFDSLMNRARARQAAANQKK
jgi:hypothetical protein